MTLREYIDIINDIDGYIAGGGKLLELTMPDLSGYPPAVLETIDPAAASRLGRFLLTVGAEMGGAGETPVKEVMTEEHARAIWQGTKLTS